MELTEGDESWWYLWWSWCLSFLAFSDLIYHLKDTGIGVFWLYCARPNLEVALKKLLHQQLKMLGSFSAMSWMEMCPYSYFRWCGYFQFSWVSFVTTDKFLVRAAKIISWVGFSWGHSLPVWFWTLFNSMKQPYYQKDVNQIILNHTTL